MAGANSGAKIDAPAVPTLVTILTAYATGWIGIFLPIKSKSFLISPPTYCAT